MSDLITLLKKEAKVTEMLEGELFVINECSYGDEYNEATAHKYREKLYKVRRKIVKELKKELDRRQ
ncbi:hypothetical protein N9112_00410 [bacterium]|nr:hypothetical protein [bacterium]